MVNGTVGLIIVVVILVVIGLEWNQAQEIISAGQSYLQSQGVSSTIGLNPQAGQNVCDLKIVFSPQLVVAGGPSISGFVNLLTGAPAWQFNGANYSWLNCHNFGLPLSFVPWQYGVTTSTALTPADVVITSGLSDHIWLSVQAPNGQIRSYTTDPFCTSLCTTAYIPSGVTNVPKQYTFTFVITGLPKQNYQISVTSELPINGNSAGQPYIQNVQG